MLSSSPGCKVVDEQKMEDTLRLLKLKTNLKHSYKEFVGTLLNQIQLICGLCLITY